MKRKACGAALAAAVVLSAFIVWSRRDGGDEGAPREEAELPSRPFPADQLLVPGDIDGYDLLRVASSDGEPSYGPGVDSWGPVVVTRVDEGVVAITSMRGSPVGAPVAGRTVAGAPVVESAGYEHLPGMAMAKERAFLAWQPSDSVILSAMSIEISGDELLDAAEQVELNGDGEVVAPGELIGEIPITWDEPMPGVTAQYDNDGYEQHVSVISAAPDVQAAYLALAPDGAVGPPTHVSCCQHNLARAPRELRIEGRTATIASIDWSKRIVVVAGNPGAVLVADSPFSDEDLIALVKSLVATPPADFVALGVAQ